MQEKLENVHRVHCVKTMKIDSKVDCLINAEDDDDDDDDNDGWLSTFNFGRSEVIKVRQSCLKGPRQPHS